MTKIQLFSAKTKLKKEEGTGKLVANLLSLILQSSYFKWFFLKKVPFFGNPLNVTKRGNVWKSSMYVILQMFNIDVRNLIEWVEPPRQNTEATSNTINT